MDHVLFNVHYLSHVYLVIGVVVVIDSLSSTRSAIVADFVIIIGRIVVTFELLILSVVPNKGFRTSTPS